MRNGIQFTNDGERGRNVIRSYQSYIERRSGSGRPSCIDKSQGHAVDIAGLRCREAKSDLVTATGNARFKIGFEIEKNSFAGRTNRGTRMTELPLVQTFEEDGSCGVEAVTHILPLLPKSAWRSKVFNMFHEASHIIEEDRSPSNYKCSLHTTISVAGMNSTTLMNALRPYCGILYSVFRFRLANHYCCQNIELLTNCSDWRGETKYSVVKNRGYGVEFRLPARIKSVRGMQLRYELFYELVNFAVNHAGKSFGLFLRRVKPIIERMYEGDAEKTAGIISLAKSFQKFLDTGRVCGEIVNFIEGSHNINRNISERSWSARYTRALARERGTEYQREVER